MCDNLLLLDPFRSLNPLLRRYSYCPRAIGASNKSRIDYFLISNSLLGRVSSCNISDNLQSSAFDHKAIILKFSGNGTDFGKQNISCRTISDPDADLLVNLSILECYLIYQDRGIDDKNQLLSLIGARRKDLREAGPDPAFYNIENVFFPDNNIRNNLIGNVREFVSGEVSRNILNFDLNIEDDVFF
jgi:hypothetical protein